MLRTAYEIVTNSRYSVFVEHQDRLAYRINARGVDLIPARVERKDDKLQLRLMEGKKILIRGKEKDLLGYAAKLPRYRQGVERSNRRQPENRREDPASFPLKYSSGSLPQHGDRVWVGFNDKGEDTIRKSVITRIAPRQYESNSPPTKDVWYKGWVFISNENILGKKYERVFIEQDDSSEKLNDGEESKKGDRTIEVKPEIAALWTELIKDYQRIHVKDLQQRDEANDSYDEYLGNRPGQTAWSRHIYEPGAEEFEEGTLCYVQLAKDNKDKVTALFPVVLSRRLYELSPKDLLAANLHPATDIKELSPAERVFGWVNSTLGKSEKTAAYKSNFRIGYVECQTKNAIAEFVENGFPLAILGQPQPQQARFYVANNKQGEPLVTQNNGNRSKKPGYDRDTQGLRGRKVYPHQRLPEGHWDIPTEEEQTTNNNGHFKEWYRQGDGENNRDNQNRSIKAWVKPDTTFTFNIDVTNLSDVELGALLWLLELPQEHYHRLGSGKPFGFGSVRLQLDRDSTDLRKGSDWKQYYSSLLPWNNTNSEFTTQDTITLYQQAVTEVYGNSDREFSQIEFIKAFCISAKGYEDNLPIHYPRIRQQGDNNEPLPPHKEGKGFEWFEKNNRSDDPVSLPSLTEDEGLPYSP